MTMGKHLIFDQHLSENYSQNNRNNIYLLFFHLRKKYFHLLKKSISFLKNVFSFVKEKSFSKMKYFFHLRKKYFHLLKKEFHF